MPEIVVVDGTNKPSSRVLIMAGWDSVPHLDEDAKRDLLENTPEWLRDARSKGIPSIGSGAIYPMADEAIRCDPFPIPAHWPRCFALDVGWNWTACLWTAYDLETLTKYHYGEYKAGQALPQIHAEAIKARGAWIPGLIDPAANNRGQRDGEKLMADYQDMGLNLTKANNAVEAGLHHVWRDLSAGRTKVFSTLQNFFAEKRLYRRNEHGVIVKKNDHLMDCSRYTHNSGDSIRKVKPVQQASASLPYAGVTTAGGY